MSKLPFYTYITMYDTILSLYYHYHYHYYKKNFFVILDAQFILVSLLAGVALLYLAFTVRLIADCWKRAGHYKPCKMPHAVVIWSQNPETLRRAKVLNAQDDPIRLTPRRIQVNIKFSFVLVHVVSLPVPLPSLPNPVF